MVKTVVLVGIAAVIVAVGVGAYGLVALQPQIQEFTVETREFGFDGASGGTMRMKAGETVRITLINVGGAEHEFMVVRDKDQFLSDLDKAIKDLIAKGLDKEEIEEAEEIETIHMMAVGQIMTGQDEEHDVDVEPRETRTFTLKIDEPGTYWYLCAELDATFPQTHAHRGMFAQLIVESR